MSTKSLLLFIITSFVVITSFVTSETTEIRSDFKTYYEKNAVTGSFVLYNTKESKWIVYNPDQMNKEFTPASTFKICNSLIGVETGVIRDENFVIPWDSVVRKNPNWNKDHNLQSAFQNSVVWYYQSLARSVGGKRMKFSLDNCNYGNRDTSGGIDKFWLTGGLRITPKQQIEFLRNLHDNALPFSQRTMNIVKNIMVVDDSTGFVMRAKSGWGFQNNQDIGWYVGYIETADNVYYFANCIQCSSPDNQKFAAARMEIVYSILRELKIVQ
ncbi:MAG TPA: class D beta-lactamase [Bacteroidia bacterium]|jgi:beta-lactamase class D|nr:class D beta-lactamase [Bacteroidia bacterium]HQF27210.1 class D beta-lactamase [Bacteroidia bacterium]HQK96502.1 class D beta-lactamase [Bacteroidia bacterium]